MAKTVKQSGLGMSRTAFLTFNCTWKLADSDYHDGQQFQWRHNYRNWSKWRTVAINTVQTSQKVSLPAADYFPIAAYRLYAIAFRVRGKRRQTTKDGKVTTYEWSDWAEYTMLLDTPAAPTITAEWDDEHENVTNFPWSANVSNTSGNAPFSNIQWQAILVKNCNSTDGTKQNWHTNQLGWRSGYSGASSAYNTPEDSVVLADGSYTRWVRVRSRGPGAQGTRNGLSAWRYARHVYAMPFKAVINSATASVSGHADVTGITVKWTAGSDNAHPIDRTVVQWAIGVPTADMACPVGLSWNDGPVTKDTTAQDGASFHIEQAPDEDECLWVRIVTWHDNLAAYSQEKLVLKGSLAMPSGLSVETNEATHRATITATNNSDVPDSALAVTYSGTNTKEFVIGVIPHGISSVTVQCPDWSTETAISFGVYAFQGTSSAVTRADNVSAYTIKANMKSDVLRDNGAVPQAPATITAESTETTGEVRLTWAWTWSDADTAELSWSTNPNAWESTEEPETYTISNIHAAEWRVSGLNTGEVWYFRARLAKAEENNLTYGPYSAMVSVDLSSAPTIPVLTLSDSVITNSGTVEASWEYVSTDGTAQVYAEICLATVAGSTITYGNVIATTQSAQHVEIAASEAGWQTGETYYLCVRVSSESRHQSGWSDPISVTIAEPVSCEITQTSLQEITIGEGGDARTVTALTAMPLTATITGAGEGGTTLLTIERLTSYILDRPDGSLLNGFAGETIATYSQSGEGQIAIDRELLIGRLDDGAVYRVIATVQDTYGQSAEESIDFEVHWNHQAIIPEASVVVDNSNLIARLTPIAPTGYAEGDTCDIYRLSAGKPVLIIQDGEFGTEYVDPYPTIGDTGGYRFVYLTENGDYITANGSFAWLDIDADIDLAETIIDFDGDRVILAYNMDISHEWEKDFVKTTYLGGSTQGDWNTSVQRGITVSADMVVIDDPDMIASMRRLAEYPGICHVRTVDGSSFAADVQVSESRSYERNGVIAAFSVAIRQVDAQRLDGMTYEEWVGE